MVCKNDRDCPYKGAMNANGEYTCNKKIGLMCSFSMWEKGDGRAEITQRRKARKVGSGDYALNQEDYEERAERVKVANRKAKRRAEYKERKERKAKEDAERLYKAMVRKMTTLTPEEQKAREKERERDRVRSRDWRRRKAEGKVAK